MNNREDSFWKINHLLVASMQVERLRQTIILNRGASTDHEMKDVTPEQKLLEDTK